MLVSYNRGKRILHHQMTRYIDLLTMTEIL